MSNTSYNTITKFKAFYGERFFEHKFVKPKICEEVSEDAKNSRQ